MRDLITNICGSRWFGYFLFSLLAVPAFLLGLATGTVWGFVTIMVIFAGACWLISPALKA